MTKYSRTAKYEDLRKSLMNDKEGETSSPTLSAFEKRLNNINPDTFKAPQEVNDGNHVPNHAKNRDYTEQINDTVTTTANDTSSNTEEKSFTPANGGFQSAFSNSLINEYINEVKKYNVDQGNAYSEDTTVNVFANLRDNSSKLPQTNVRPFGEPDHTTEVPSLTQFNAALKNNSMKTEPEVNTPVKDDDSGLIPSFSKDSTAVESASEKQSVYSANADSISKEFNMMMEEQGTGPFVLPGLTGNYGFNTDTHELGASTHQQFLNETNSIRKQIEAMEEDFVTLNEKSSRNGQLINVVMITLIIALLVALAVVLYWIFTMRGL